MLRDFYSENEENTRQELKNYFLEIANLFSNLPNAIQLNTETNSLDQVKISFRQQIQEFLLNYFLLVKSQSNENNQSIFTDLCSILNQYENHFARLLSNADEQLTVDCSNENFKELILFLNHLQEKFRELIYEKEELQQKISTLEKQNHKSPTTSNSANIPNRIDEIFNQSVNKNPRSTLCETPSPNSTLGKKSVRFSLFFDVIRNEKFGFFSSTH